jgi:hypothetical protein
MFFVVVLLLSSASAIISFVSEESFASKGTFNYTIGMAPDYLNTSSLFIFFYYGETHQIVESKFAGLSDRLRVFSAEEGTEDNVFVELSCVWMDSGQFSIPYQASSSGIDLPHGGGWDGINSAVVNVGDLI